MSGLLPFLWWHWCLFGLALVLLEMLLPGVFLLWIGIGAFLTGGLVGLFGIADWQAQSLIFVPLSFISLFLGRRFIRRARPAEDETLNRRLAIYVGRNAEVVQPVVNGQGRVRLGDTLWRVRGEDCPAGTQVAVVAVEGSDLIVKILSRPDDPAKLAGDGKTGGA